MTKAYSYIRFSCLKDFNPNKLKNQLREAREYAASRNLIFDETFSFQDMGVSGFHGRNIKAGKLGLFLYAIQNGIVEKGSYLLIENLDRLSRETARHALRTLEAILEEGIIVVTMGDRKEYTIETLDNDPTELLYSILIFIRGNEESQTKSRRISAAWVRRVEAARRGEIKTLSGKVPTWLRLVGDRYLLVGAKVEVIKRMFQMAKVGMGCTTIASKFNFDSVPTFLNAPKWKSAHIIYLLRNPAVTGRLVPRSGKIVDGKKVYEQLEPVLNFYPRIISERLWKVVQKEIDGRRDQVKALRGVKNNAPKNIFGHITFCQDCGSIMRRKKRNIMLTRQTESQAYLVCGGAEEDNKCKFNPVLYRPIHDAFLKKGARMVGNHYLSLSENGNPESGKDKSLEWALLEPKMNDLKKVLSVLQVDRAQLNLALRNLFSKVVIRIEKGVIEFHWAYGGFSELSFVEENKKYITRLIRKLEITPD